MISTIYDKKIQRLYTKLNRSKELVRCGFKTDEIMKEGRLKKSTYVGNDDWLPFAPKLILEPLAKPYEPF